jgi:hypothetical protein
LKTLGSSTKQLPTFETKPNEQLTVSPTSVNRLPAIKPNLVTPLAEGTIVTSIWDDPYELAMSSTQFSILSCFEEEEEIPLEKLVKTLKSTRFQLEYPLLVILRL